MATELAQPAFDAIWDYVLVIGRGKGLPNHLRYTIFERILEELAQVGWLIFQAECLPDDRNHGYKRRGLFMQADNIFQQTKFDIRLLLHEKALEKRRSHLYKLEAELGRRLRTYLGTTVQA